MLRRLPLFAVAWLMAGVAWVFALVLRSPRALPPGLAMVVGQLALLAGGGVLARRGATAAAVRAILVAVCIGLGASTMVPFVLVGTVADVLAFVLLTLFLLAALLFAWGWRAELVVVGTTLALAGATLPFSAAVVPVPAFVTAVAIGVALSLAVAEASARAFATAFRHRAFADQRQRELEAAYDAYRDLAENARDFIYAGDLAGRITYVNAPLAAFLGAPVDAMVGRFFHDFIRPHPDNPDLDAVLAALGAGHSVSLLTFATRTAAGTRWVEVLPSGIRGPDGRVVGVRGIGRDVTERRRAAEALRESEERFRNVFGGAPIGMAVVGLDGVVLQVNRALCAMIGYGPTELGGAPLDAIVESGEASTQETIRALTTGAPRFESEQRYRHKDGHTVWCQLTASLVRDAAGEPAYVIAQLKDVTNNKRAEQALRESEERFRRTFDSASIGVIVVDVEGRAVQVNPAFCAMLGYDEGELRGVSFQAVSHPDDVEATATCARAALQGGAQSYHLEKRYLHKRGHVVWGLLSSALVRDAQGTPLYFISQIQDITERKGAEEALRESERRYRGLVESQHDLIARFDTTLRLVFVNDAYCAKLGRTREELLGHSWIPFVELDDLRALMEAMPLLDVPPYRICADVRARTPEGERWIAWEGSAIKDAGGRTIEFQTVGRDVTERRAAEQALRNSEERYRGLVQSQYDLVSRFTPEGHFTFVNDVYCREYGLSRDALIGRHFADFLHPDDVAPTLAVIAAAEQPPHRGAVETRHRTVRGWRWVSWEGCVIKDAQGVTVEIQAVGRDVTERRAAEEALRATVEELRRSEERLRLLTQREARIREDERKRLGFDLHDNVCQELIGIAILVESARRRVTPLQESAAGDLDRVVRYTHELVEHLRMLARDMRPMLLRDLGLEESLRSLAEGMGSATTDVTAEFPSAVPRLDEELEVAVYRIAQEALANAVRHAAAGAVVLTLAARDGRLELTVRDDGRGFDPEQHVRSPALGLVSMRERALALRGRLDVTSAPGVGTVVRFECPLPSRAAA